MGERMVEVGCRIPNGINLRVSDWVKGPNGQDELREVGMYQLAGSGRHVAGSGLLGGKDDATYTEIPADMWAAWLKMNERTDLHTSGAVFERGKDPMAGPDADADADGGAEAGQGQDTGQGAGVGAGSAEAGAREAPPKGRRRKATAPGGDAGKGIAAGQPAGGSAVSGTDSLTGSSGPATAGGAGSGEGVDTGAGAGSETLPGSGQDSARGAGDEGRETIPGAGLGGV